MPRRSFREWAADLAYIWFACLVGGFFFLATYTDPAASDETAPVRLEAAVWLILVAATIGLRRRRPVLLAVLCQAGAIMATGGLGFAAMAVLNVAVRRSWRVSLPLASSHVLLVGTLWWLVGEGEPGVWEGVVTIALLHTTLVAVGLLVRSQRQLVLAAQERARQAEEGQRLRVEEARHHERERLAREMHDVLAHRISLLAVHAGALEYRGNLPEEEARMAQVIRQCAHDALEDLREVIGMLREDPAENGERPQPALTDLPGLIEQSRQAGTRVTLEERVPDPPSIPARIGRHAYRIVQEGLTNARKHAPGTHVRVTVTAVPGDGLTIEVANPLPVGGVPAALPGAGAGLIGLRERVGIVGGRLEHGRTPDGDFRLRAWLPLPR
ncbi:sensor histidine kinase [Thermomonospora cellulosilytica]|uniref:histidine kinase n=1 Tax=Thermomonospora cellulosilytica TaxID=1411118 RepID=A0A7W3N0W6_9ACTN|nr:histidine kinase [Thermomonospora cellulosilytica]MBA9005499.1 signal transduction histidine kinase [Thermomonospora cellulosilytica]